MDHIKKNRGFTLIELLVVIAIVGILASIVLVSVNDARIKARDARRKTDLHNIALALDMYYAQHGSYPLSPNQPAGPQTSADYSTLSSWLNDLVVENLFSKPPTDPINNDLGPWCYGGGAAGKNTIYTYASNGQHYILCTWLENTSDKKTLQYEDVLDPFGQTYYLRASYGYSNYNYVITK